MEIEVYTGREFVKIQYGPQTVFNAIKTNGIWCIETSFSKIVFKCISKKYAIESEDILRKAVRALTLVVEKPVRMPTDQDLFG
jgi:hypothetical protein